MSSSISDLLSPVTFNGASSFSSSFQQVFQRAVSIAALPLKQMQNRVSDLQSQTASLLSFEATFSALQKSITDIGSTSKGSLSATSSASSVVSATVTSTALAGTYSIEVTALGSSSTTLSKSTLPVVTDPYSDNLSTDTDYTLNINGTDHTLTAAGTSMNDLATAINSAGLGVHATILNLGSNATPDYRLSVTSDNLGADTIQLSDQTTTLLDTVSTGSAAQYKVAGNNTIINSNSRQVTLAPGLTANLLDAAPGQPVTITVAASYGSLSNNLANFATAYNAAADAIAQQHGSQAGYLQGQSSMLTLSETLRNLTQYSSGSGTVQSITNLGLELGSDGHITFDPVKFSALNTSAVQQFLGSTSTTGFLKVAHDALSMIADPITGILQGTVDSLRAQITNQQTHIADEQTRITSLQASLQKQLTAADAAIATLEAQKSYFSDLFTAQYLTNNLNGSSQGQ